MDAELIKYSRAQGLNKRSRRDPLRDLDKIGFAGGDGNAAGEDLDQVGLEDIFRERGEIADGGGITAAAAQAVPEFIDERLVTETRSMGPNIPTRSREQERSDGRMDARGVRV